MQGSLKNILILENNPPLLRVLSDCLELSGYTPYSATTIREANAIFSKQSIDLIVSDYNLDDQHSGLEFIRSMQQSGKCQHGILMSGVIRDEEITQLELRGIPLLSKPFVREDLIKSIENLAD